MTPTDTTASPIGMAGIRDLCALERPDLKDPPFIPSVPSYVSQSGRLFATIRQQDVLLYHPYDSFTPVVEFIREAANDPDVLAIKQTLYRVNPKSPIIDALMEAHVNGKQVAVLVELKARFDEAHNLEDAATTHLGVEVTRRSLYRTLSRLERKGRGILAAIHDEVRGAQSADDLRVRMENQVRPAHSRALASVEALLEELEPFVLVRPGSVRGLVLDATGQPAPRTGVLLSGNGLLSSRVTSDGAGEFLFVRLPPGTLSSMRHWHSHEDEFLYVLEGEAVLITIDGEQVLKPGMCAGFPAGKADGHHLANRTDKDVVYLEVGDRSDKDVCEYSDIDMRGFAHPDGFRYTRKDGTKVKGHYVTKPG